MATCIKGTSYQTSAHGLCECVGDGEYFCADGTRWFDAGGQADTQDVIAAQDRRRSGSGAALKTWAPWVLGGVAVGGLVWLLRR